MTDKMKDRLSWRDFIPEPKVLGKIIGYVALLYVLQVYVIVPFMTYVVKSDFFASPGTFKTVNGDIGAAAQNQCHRFFREEMATDRVEFPLGDGKVWGMNGGRYLVKGSAVVSDDLELGHRINFTCYVKYRGGDVYGTDSWQLKGLDWLEAERTQ
ncbi:MAG TPA: hypothetical protein ENI90_08800 [Methylothermaceae bacterium]|nr:hypothetical protein [Methylothermaceae bacterium]